MNVSENTIKEPHNLMRTIAAQPEASERVKQAAKQVQWWIDTLHGLLCADHMPSDQHVETNPRFDLSKFTGRRL